MPEYTSSRLLKQTKQKIKDYAKEHNIPSINQPWKLASDDEIINLWHANTIKIDSDKHDD